jgi:hypothetical protein
MPPVTLFSITANNVEAAYGDNHFRVLDPNTNRLPDDVWSQLSPATSGPTWDFLQCASFPINNQGQNARAQKTDGGAPVVVVDAHAPPLPMGTTNVSNAIATAATFLVKRTVEDNPDVEFSRTIAGTAAAIVIPWLNGAEPSTIDETMLTAIGTALAGVPDAIVHLYKVVDPRTPPTHPLHQTTIGIPIHPDDSLPITWPPALPGSQ